MTCSNFALDGEQHTVLSVDPTFNLGDFDVIVTTYRHLILTNMSGNHPLMMGPLSFTNAKNSIHIILLHRHL